MPKIVVTDATFPNLRAEQAVAARYGATLLETKCTSSEDVIRAAAAAAVFLASDEARFMTAEWLVIDGGRSALFHD